VRPYYKNLWTGIGAQAIIYSLAKTADETDYGAPEVN
jgi:hypothetical protein